MALDGLAQLRDVAGSGLVAGDSLAQRVDLGIGRLVTRDDVAQLGDLRGGRHEVGVKRLAQVVVGDGLAQRRDLVLERAHRLDPIAQRLGLALELVQTAAVVAADGGALDRDVRELLADGVGAALDLVDPLQSGGELGAGGLALTLTFALQALDRGREFDASGLRRLLVLGADLLKLGRDVDAIQARLERGAGGVGAAGGLGDRLDGARLGGGNGLADPGVGQRRGLGAVALELVDAGVQALGSGLGLRELGLLLVAIELARDRGQRALDVRAQRGGLLAGLAARLLELRGQTAGDALELVDALQRAEQAGDDRGGVVEVVDAALDARIEIRQALLGIGVGGGALGLAAGQLGLDPRGRGQRAEDDQGAGGPPALPRLRLRLERLLERADDDRVLLAHAQQHQVHRQLEGQVLEEEREVEALVELDRDEDGLEREDVTVGAAAGEAHGAGCLRRLAGGEEPAPRVAFGRQRVAADQRLEESLAEDVLARLIEQQLGGLGPLGDGALAIGEDEIAVDDLAQQRVERVDRLSGLRQDGVGRIRHGVHRGRSPESGQGVRTSLYRQM